MQEPLEGISCQLSLLFFFFLFFIFFISLLYFLYGDDVNARCILYPAPITEMPAPDVKRIWRPVPELFGSLKLPRKRGI